MIGFLWSLYSDTIFLWCENKTPDNKNLLELIKRWSKVQEKNMWMWFKFWPIPNIFQKTISQWEFDYDLFTNLLRTIVTCDFSPSSFKLRGGILPLLTKCVS